jgi:uncharacterized protein YcbK (DUF882 family)
MSQARTKLILPLFIILLAFFSSGVAASTHQETSDMPRYLRGDGTITIFRPDKNLRETFTYADSSGAIDESAMARIAHFFRCRLTDEFHDIDWRLIETLDSIEDHFGAKEIRLISGYRSPTRNAIMAGRGRRVAKDSLHMYGKAADIEISDVSPVKLRDFAYSLHQGGVGYYGRKFIHVDSGPQRTWGFRPPAKARTKPASANQ